MRDTPNKPQTISGDLHNLPDAFARLISMSHWLLWRWEFVENNWTKVPYQTNSRKAKSNDPATWTTYDLAIKAMDTGKFDGIGFCLLNANFGAFDIDKCRDPASGALDPWAAELVQQCRSYTEITPSGTGLRVIGIGTGSKIDNSWPIANGVKLEAYRNSARYITVTGNPLPEFNVGFADLDIHIDETAAELDLEKLIQQDAGKGIFHERSREKSPPAINLTGIELERFADAIEWVPNPDLKWNAWNRLGLSIHRATGGSEFGCRLFHKLSAKSSKYSDKATDARWKRYHTSRPTIITGNTIYGEAHRAGWDGKCRAQREDKENKPGNAGDGGHHERQKQPLFYTSGEFVAGYAPPDYSIEGLLLRRRSYALTGPTGSGKTSIALRLAAHKASGKSLVKMECDKGNVLFFAGENPDDVRMRWIKLCEEMELDPQTLPVYFLDGVWPIMQDDFKRGIFAEVKAIGDLDLLIIDTSAAYFQYEDENARVQMRKHAEGLRDFTALRGGPSVLTTCHPIKNYDPEYLVPAGGGSYINEVDGNLVAMRDPGSMIVSVHWHGKFRGPDFAPIPFKIQTGFSPKLLDSKGRQLPTVTVAPIGEAEKAVMDEDLYESRMELLSLMNAKPALSLSLMATELQWSYSNGEPNKTRVQRALATLEKHKLVESKHNGWFVTKAGKEAAKPWRPKQGDMDFGGGNEIL